MNIEQFQVFRTIAQVKSFTKAAKILNFTQPAISSQIKLLEQSYNVTLFERCNNGVRLTEAGKKFYEYGDRILAMYEEMELEIAKLTGINKEVINIGASYTAGNYYMPQVILNFKELYPNAFVRLNISNSAQVINEVKERNLDVGIVEGNMTYDRDLEIYKVGTDELVLIVPATDKWLNKKSITMEELVNEPFVSREETSGMRQYFSNFLSNHGINYDDMNIVMEITNSEAIKHAVVNNQGIAIVPSPVVKRELEQGTLLRMDIENFNVSWDIEVIWRARESLTGLKEEFLRYLLNPNTISGPVNPSSMKFI